jgi:hypothetical protein
MTVLSVYTLALLACALNLAVPRWRADALRSGLNSARHRAERVVRTIGIDRCALLAIALLVCLYFAQMHQIDEFVHLTTNESRVSYDVAMFALDVVEVLTLGLLYVSLSMSALPRTVRAALIVAPIIMYGFSISTTIVATSDLYAYIAYAKLGWQAYSPPNVPFSGPFAMLNGEIARAWVTLNPAPYGPLFIALDHLVAAPAASVMQALVSLRLLALAALVVCLISLRALRFGTPLLAVVALDPQIVDNYIFDAHNDVLALAAVLAAMALAKRSRIAAIVLAIAAGLIKAPYALLALLVSVDEPSLLRRTGVAAIIAVGTVAISAVGGSAYLHALTFHGVQYGVNEFSLLTTTIHALAAAAAIAAIGAAVIFRRTLFSAVWLFPALAAQALHWYAALGIPYAVMERRNAALFFTLFPVTTYLLNEYTIHPYPLLAAVLIIFGFALFALASKGDASARSEQIVAAPSGAAPR